MPDLEHVFSATSPGHRRPAAGLVRVPVRLRRHPAVRGRLRGQLRALQGGRDPAPFGSFDTPANGATGVTGAIPVTGWALDDVEVTKRRDLPRPAHRGADAAQRQGLHRRRHVRARGAVRRGQRLPDLSLLLPARAGATCCSPTCCPTAATGPSRSTPTPTTARASRRCSARRRSPARTRPPRKPFGTIDTPGQGETVSGTVVELRLGADAAARRHRDRRVDDLGVHRRRAGRAIRSTTSTGRTSRRCSPAMPTPTGRSGTTCIDTTHAHQRDPHDRVES